jgi:hypothetical protein
MYQALIEKYGTFMTIAEVSEVLEMPEPLLISALRSKDIKIPGDELDGKWLFVTEHIAEYVHLSLQIPMGRFRV